MPSKAEAAAGGDLFASPLYQTLASANARGVRYALQNNHQKQ
jgi:hypothetical protein